MNNYHKYANKYIVRRREWALEYLGGRCVKCRTVNNLQFDHIDKNNCSFRIGANFKTTMVRLRGELDKCQLLCKEHHLEKTLMERGWNKASHGSTGMYVNRKCRCEACKSAWATYQRVYLKTWRLKKKHALMEL